jgi:hypothetical protein
MRFWVSSLSKLIFGCACFAVVPALQAQSEDPGKRFNTFLAAETGGRVQLQFEIRQRAESRTGQLFGQDRDIAADFIRTRVGLVVKPKKWIKVVAVTQDTRAPFYGMPAPGNVRDPLDLQQAYVEIFSERQRGFGLTAGRLMINLGDTRLIGSPQWAYVARTWDTARAYHVSAHARLELLFLATGVPRSTGFNKPVLGDRIWGTYNTFEKVAGKHAIDAYMLRHDQNRPGGFLGKGTLGITLIGTRWALALPKNFRSTTEVIAQRGHVGDAQHRASALAVQFGRRTAFVNHPIDIVTEYKYASGTKTGGTKSGTFDPLYPGVHDKFGHADLMGWRNIHNTRAAITLTARKNWNWILMYNNSWIAQATDALYSTAGRAIARDPSGQAGRHVGQELDLYTNYVSGGIAIGAGVGQFFPGEFIRNTTPGAHSRLVYLSTGYSF